MNAVNEEMYLELLDVMGLMRNDPDIRCLILTGSVFKREGIEKQAFCAGADLKRHSSGERTAAQRREYIKIAHDTTRVIYEFPKPVIAAVNGPARGAGTELALSCDLLLIAEEATLGLPETGLGTFVGGGVTHVLPRLVGLARAKELVYTGRVVGGETAVALGLALACYPVARLPGEARALAMEISEKAPIPMAFAKGGNVALDKLLDARSVAVVGASRDEKKRGFQTVRALIDGKYEGPVYPVNPHEETILGLKCYPSVLDIEDTPELAFICTPAETVPAILEECGSKGVPGVVVIAGGFGELGRKGKQLQDRIVNIAAKRRMRLLGPNTSGIINVHSGLNLAGIDSVPKGDLALVSQSGNVALHVITEARLKSHKGFSYYVGKRILDSTSTWRSSPTIRRPRRS
jgi:enoyl-CoA hydratase/carnithine racemase